MTREIKFRCYDEGRAPNSRYVGDLGVKPGICEVLSIHLRKGTMRYRNPDLCDPTDGSIKNLMQYGLEIYEGDILLFEDNLYNPSEGENPKWLGVVEWRNDWCGYVVIDEHETNSLWDVYDEKVEVIGNKYENPELLDE